MRILYFEGAGWFGADISTATDMKNCRVRTAFSANNGHRIYLEISAHMVTKNASPLVKQFKHAGWVTYCYYITGDCDDCNKNKVPGATHKVFEYNKANVLSFVNSLGCSFDDVVTLPDLAGYRVFKNSSEYNYGDKFVFNAELTKRAEEIDKYFYELEKSEGRKYPVFSLWLDESKPNMLHLLRHFNGYNKHWTITNVENWQDTIVEAKLGKYGC